MSERNVPLVRCFAEYGDSGAPEGEPPEEPWDLAVDRGTDPDPELAYAASSAAQPSSPTSGVPSHICGSAPALLPKHARNTHVEPNIHKRQTRTTRNQCPPLLEWGEVHALSCQLRD